MSCVKGKQNIIAFFFFFLNLQQTKGTGFLNNFSYRNLCSNETSFIHVFGDFILNPVTGVQVYAEHPQKFT